MFHRLLEAYGPQGWWPGDSTTEIIVGAILTQNTAWTNVERAIANLRSADILSWNALHKISESDLAELIRPSGTYRVKTRRLKSFVEVLWRDHHGSLDDMLRGPLNDVRARLLAIPGIGPETADAILLYAAQRATFVVDAYTQRVLRRHRLVPGISDYDTAQSMFHAALPRDATLFNEFHALFVAVGKQHCRPRACCTGCPLEAFPHDGSL